MTHRWPAGSVRLWLEDQHRRNVAAAYARDLARRHDYLPTKPPSSTNSDGGAVRSTPAPHPTPRPDGPKEIQ